MVKTCWETLEALAMEDERIIIFASDSLNHREQFLTHNMPQYIEMGIAEANLIAAASGAAACGLKPYAYAVAPFLIYRANEFIRNDVCLQKRDVKIIGYSAGMDYCTSGPTHHTTEDIAMLSVLPYLTILSPASALEVKEMIRATRDIEGPVYIRLNRECGREIHEEGYRFDFSHAECLQEGTDITVCATGSIVYDVWQAVRIAKTNGINAEFLNIGVIKPIDRETIMRSLKRTGKVLTVEEHSVIGGLGSIVASLIAEEGSGVRLWRMGLQDCFASGYGNHDEVKGMNGLSIDDITQMICEIGRKCNE